MDEQLKALEEKSRDLGTLMQRIEALKAPEGNLQVLSCGKRTLYYQYFGGGIPRKYLNRSQVELLAELAQKRYNQQVFRAAQAKKKAVDQCVAILKSDDYLFNLSSIYEALPAQLKALVKPIESLDTEYVQKWQAQTFKREKMRYEAVFKTKRGEYVRSKSELIIADRLYDVGIPYHYEVELRNQYGKLLTRPDFYVLNPRTKKEYLWEHFGMLDNPEYANDFITKINLYSQYGYHIGENLIITLESSQHPLTTEQIHMTIEKYLK